MTSIVTRFVDRFRKPGRKAFKTGRHAHQAYTRNPADLSSLEDCVKNFCDALQYYPETHHKFPFMCITVACADFLLYQHQGQDDLRHISKIIQNAEKAVQLYAHSSTRGFYDASLNLGTFYRRRFELTREVGHGEQAIEAHKQAAKAPSSVAVTIRPNFKKRTLIELGISEWTFCDIVWQTQGTVPAATLDGAIQALKEALHLSEDEKDDQDARCLQNLGNAFCIRHRFSSQSGKYDLDRAIDFYEQALTVVPDSPESYIGLARALSSRNAEGDAERAGQHANTALELSKDTNPTIATLAHTILGTLHENRYQQTKNVEDLQVAVSHLEAALEGKPDDADLTFKLATVRCNIIDRERGTEEGVVNKERLRNAREAVELAMASCANDRARMDTLGRYLEGLAR